MPNARNISLCILFSLIFWYDLFLPQTTDIVAENIDITVKSPLSFLIEDILPPGSFSGKMIGLGLYLLLCFGILRLNEVFSFIRVRTTLPFLFCFVTGGILLRPHLFSLGVIVALLVLLSVFFSFKLLTEENPKYAFNVALLLFTAALFSFSCVWLIVAFWLFAYSGNVLSFRTFLASLLGALVPALYAVVGFEITGSEQLLFEYIQDSFALFAVDFHFSLYGILYLLFTGFLLLLAFVDFMLTHSQENIKPRKEFFYLCTLFGITLALIILSVPDSGMLLWLSIVSGSFLPGRYFSLRNNRFTRALLSVYFAGSLLLLFVS